MVVCARLFGKWSVDSATAVDAVACQCGARNRHRTDAHATAHSTLTFRGQSSAHRVYMHCTYAHCNNNIPYIWECAAALRVRRVFLARFTARARDIVVVRRDTTTAAPANQPASALRADDDEITGARALWTHASSSLRLHSLNLTHHIAHSTSAIRIQQPAHTHSGHISALPHTHTHRGRRRHIVIIIHHQRAVDAEPPTTRQTPQPPQHIGIRLLLFIL